MPVLVEEINQPQTPERSTQQLTSVKMELGEHISSLWVSETNELFGGGEEFQARRETGLHNNMITKTKLVKRRNSGGMRILHLK